MNLVSFRLIFQAERRRESKNLANPSIIEDQSTFFHLFRLKRNGTEENIRFESWLRSRHKYVAELAEILIYL